MMAEWFRALPPYQSNAGSKPLKGFRLHAWVCGNSSAEAILVILGRHIETPSILSGLVGIPSNDVVG